MVGDRFGGDADHASAPFWQDTEHEHARMFFSRKLDCHVHDVIATDGKENRHKTTADINEIALKSCSNFDVVKNASCNDHPERFYHGFVPGLMVGLRDQFEIQQTGKADSDAMISF